MRAQIDRDVTQDPFSRHAEQQDYTAVACNAGGTVTMGCERFALLNKLCAEEMERERERNKQNRRKLSIDERDEIRRRLQAGEEIHEIAEAMQCGVLSVSAIQSNLTRQRNSPSGRVTDEQRAQIIRLHREGLSYLLIAVRVGVARGTVERTVQATRGVKG